MTPSALLFDAYGTLWDVHSVIQHCERCWPGKGVQLSQLWRTKQLEYTWLRTLMGRYVPFSEITRDALAYACAALGLDLAEERKRELMDAYLRLEPYPDTGPTLQRLGSVRKAILTNGSPDMIEPLVKHSGFGFDAVLSVDSAKVFKTAPAAYRLALERFGGSAADMGFVSSNCWDAHGAKSFGFRVFWINRQGAPMDNLGFTPDAVLKSLGELPEVLR